MKSYQSILLILLLFLSVDGLAQKKVDKKQKYSRQSSQELLKRARQVKDKSPTQAINLVEQALTMKEKKRSSNVEVEAYMLLGNIYEQIDQKELALQRYDQALAIERRKKASDVIALLYERMGQLHLGLKNADAAKASFTLCIESSRDKSLRLKCEEGLADVQILLGNADASTAQLDNVQQNYQLDSIELARLEARRSQVYVQQKDYDKASEALRNSIDNLPKGEPVKKEDFEPIEKAQKVILADEAISNKEKIAVSTRVSNNAIKEESNNLSVQENLSLAELYKKENNLPEAERLTNLSKGFINDKTDAALAAEVYKKSAEYNQQKGRIKQALNDLEKYSQSKEKALNKLENDLKQQIEIVKGQKQIDVRQLDISLEEKDRQLLQSELQTQKIITAILGLVLLASLIYFYFLYKNVKEKRKANQLLLLKSLRTQMNPHFIFNALNSVNNFIAKNDEKAANKFLSDFSSLMRKVLDYSQKDFISFEEEMELNELYLKLEHFRFREKFDYTFDNQAREKAYDLQVPPMLIQPFIENAVWHGLRYKEDHGKLEVVIKANQNQLVINIKDNGIGRAKSKALKTKNQKQYKSTGLNNVSKRIALLNEIYDKNYEIKIQDADSANGDVGTFVKITIPVDA